jgi:hypothetical protein
MSHPGFNRERGTPFRRTAVQRIKDAKKAFEKKQYEERLAELARNTAPVK